MTINQGISQSLNPRISTNSRLKVNRLSTTPDPIQMYPGGKTVDPSNKKLHARTRETRSSYGENGFSGRFNNKALKNSYTANSVASKMGGFGGYRQIPSQQLYKRTFRNISGMV